MAWRWWHTKGMAQNPDTHPKGRIVIALHQLWVEVEHEALYPDQMNDLSNRALELFANTLVHCKQLNMDIRDIDPFIYDNDEDDE